MEKRITQKAALTCIAFLAFTLPTAMRADSIVNGGFENGTNTLTNATTGWALSPASSGSNFYYGSPSHGGNYAAVFGGSPGFDTISQTIQTATATLYTLSFWLTNEGASPDGGSFLVLWDGRQIANIAASTAFGYTRFSFSNLTATGNDVVSFSASNADSFFAVDDVSAVSPEPSSVLLLGSGSIMVAGFAYSQRRSRAPLT